MRLFSNRSQRTSKCGKNKEVAHEAQQLNRNGFSFETRYYKMFQLKMVEKVLFWETTNISMNVFPSLKCPHLPVIFLSN